MTKKNGLPCKKCGTSEWSANGSCKKCKNDSGRRWRQENPNEARELDRERRNKYREKRAEYDKLYRITHPDKMAEKAERAKRNGRLSDRKKEYNRKWVQNNPEKNAAKKNRYRTRKTAAGGSYTADEFKALCNHYGNKCLRCGRENVKLTPDHVLPVIKGGSSNINNIQPLCSSCNSAKGGRHIDYRPDAGPLRWLQAKLFG